ncbi:MAG: hypothetical protein M1814_003510 [Vezdaea aestivalis]|nr:MAG: hypothetical protein M1814_003510 [Vezdaea aestivalis]
MPPLRSASSRKSPPAGFSDIEPTLLSYAAKMRLATSSSSSSSTPTQDTTTSRHASLWPITQITHQRSRYIYNLYYESEDISKPLYEWLLKNRYADAALIAKWKKMGYEQLCCVRCVQAAETNFGGVCVCRVPKAQMVRQRKREGKGKELAKEGEDGDGEVEEVPEQGGGAGDIQCVNCGCRGCASGD